MTTTSELVAQDASAHYVINVLQGRTNVASIEQVGSSAWTLTVYTHEPTLKTPTTSMCTSAMEALDELYTVEPHTQISCEIHIWQGVFLCGRISELATAWKLQMVDPRFDRWEGFCTSPQEALEQFYTHTRSRVNARTGIDF